MKFSLLTVLSFVTLFTESFAIEYKCNLPTQIICNDFKNHLGKFCSGNTCYDRDTRLNDKSCSSESAMLCESFKSKGGYVCSNALCVIQE